MIPSGPWLNLLYDSPAGQSEIPMAIYSLITSLPSIEIKIGPPYLLDRLSFFCLLEDQVIDQ